ncbi:TetR/AcrR family transcriptional regulator [Polymorphospora rubra]|uniref:TetR/AcrR family transcriptional regulator n=1 Tax=Polymorphospora rubra TaxID=338584 RepID=UPI003400DB67
MPAPNTDEPAPISGAPGPISGAPGPTSDEPGPTSGGSAPPADDRTAARPDDPARAVRHPDPAGAAGHSEAGARAGARPPGRPRSTRADEAIVEAVLDLLAEGGSVETLSVEAVAARAGVGKATIYRRWPGKDALLVDALRTLKGAPAEPAGDSVRDDVVTLLEMVGRHTDERTARIMTCLAPQFNRSPEQDRLFQEIMEPRREVLRRVLRRGITTGELRPDLDVELTVAMLSGPVLLHRIIWPLPNLAAADLAGRVVDTLLAGIAGPAAGPTAPPAGA